jgi:hypothetical protein
VTLATRRRSLPEMAPAAAGMPHVHHVDPELKNTELKRKAPTGISSLRCTVANITKM